LEIIGGCGGCGATLAAYNAYPSKAGYWLCKDCLGHQGWEDVAEANHDIFEVPAPEDEMEDPDPYYQSDVPPAWFDPTYAGERWDEDY
jgi:hypothetical protein